MNENNVEISGNICPTMVVKMQKNKKFMCNTSRVTIRYFSTAASEDPVVDIGLILIVEYN